MCPINLTTIHPNDQGNHGLSSGGGEKRIASVQCEFEPDSDSAETKEKEEAGVEKMKKEVATQTAGARVFHESEILFPQCTGRE